MVVPRTVKRGWVSEAPPASQLIEFERTSSANVCTVNMPNTFGCSNWPESRAFGRMRPERSSYPMKRFLIFIGATLVALAFAVPAMAQDSANVRYKAKTEIDFEDVSVDGELKKPHGAYLLEKRQSSFNPLINMKVDFTAEMIESVNQIR